MISGMVSSSPAACTIWFNVAGSRTISARNAAVSSMLVMSIGVRQA
jgi:hypothetical protein